MKQKPIIYQLKNPHILQTIQCYAERYSWLDQEILPDKTVLFTFNLIQKIHFCLSNVYRCRASVIRQKVGSFINNCLMTIDIVKTKQWDNMHTWEDTPIKLQLERIRILMNWNKVVEKRI